MAERSCTLKDIALKCGVSPAIVSIVLNGKEGQMKCSAATRQLILQTAREMEYHPNILARSIKKNKVPIVGVFLRRSAMLPHVLGRAMSARLGNITAVLNQLHYEVLFVPYSDASEQYERMKSLIAQGLLGGIITNIDFNDNSRICELLQSSALPYLVLGKPAAAGTFCLYSNSSALEKLCSALAAEKGCTQCISVEPAEEHSLIYRLMPFPHGHIWAAPEYPEEKLSSSMKNTLFVVMGAVLLEDMYKRGIVPEHYVCVEPEEDKKKLAGLHDTFFLQELHSVEHYLQETYKKWLIDDIVPEKCSVQSVVEQECFTFIKKFSQN